MKALQDPSVGTAPTVVTVPDAEPGPGQVLLKVTAAGACHSGVAVMGMSAGQLDFPLPLTLGHEGVGTVPALGPGASGVAVGGALSVGFGTLPHEASVRSPRSPYWGTRKSSRTCSPWPGRGSSTATSRGSPWTRHPAPTSCCTRERSTAEP